MRAYANQLVLILLWTSLAWTQGYLGPKGYIGPKGVIGGGSVTPTFTLVQTLSNIAVASGTTGTITGTISSGHLVIIGSSTVNTGVTMNSVTNIGTLVPCIACQGGSGTDSYEAYAFVYPSSGGSNPVVTFSGTTGGAELELREYSLNTDTPNYDTGGGANVGSCTSPFSGVTLTLTGVIEDVIAQSAGSSSSVTAVNSPWSSSFTNGSSGGNTGASFAGVINTLSGTAPTWTGAGTSSCSKAALAFAAVNGSVSNEQVFDWSGGTTGNTPASGDLGTSTHGVNTGITWTTTNASSLLKYSNVAHYPLLTSLGVLFSGPATTYSDTSSLVLLYSSTSVNQGYVVGTLPSFPAPATTISMGGWIYTTFTSSDTLNDDIFTIHGASSDFINAILGIGGGSLQIAPETAGGNTGGCSGTINISTATQYWLTMLYQSTGNGVGTHKIRVYQSDGVTQVGSEVTCNVSASPDPSSALDIGLSSVGAGQTTGRVVRFGAVAYSPTGVWPLLP